MTTSIFTVTNWNEQFTVEKSVAHATATYQLTGDLEGSMAVNYSICYLHYDEVTFIMTRLLLMNHLACFQVTFYFLEQ